LRNGRGRARLPGDVLLLALGGQPLRVPLAQALQRLADERLVRELREPVDRGLPRVGAARLDRRGGAADHPGRRSERVEGARDALDVRRLERRDGFLATAAYEGGARGVDRAPGRGVGGAFRFLVGPPAGLFFFALSSVGLTLRF